MRQRDGEEIEGWIRSDKGEGLRERGSRCEEGWKWGEREGEIVREG